MVGGVAGGLSARFGIDANLLRLIFAVLSIGDGSGFALYVLAWLVIPRQGETISIGRRALGDRRTVALGLAIATVLGSILLALAALGLTFAANLIWPVSLGTTGLVVVWRAASDEEKTFLRQVVEQAPVVGIPDRRTPRALIVRVVVGVVLIAAGLGGLVATRHPTGATLDAVGSAAVVILGFLVMFGPWWLAVARDLSVERRERVRTQERADMAAAIHDSVLQTLALIQRSSGDPREVTRLARAQERELRAWLFDARPPGSFDPALVTTLAEGVSVIESEVEESHRVAVVTVVVGDCALTESMRALLAAGREATANAAAWSGAPTVSMFVEVEPNRVSMFVRDRGKGFDPADVGEDRRGISESIRARISRHGGTADIRSTPGEGTEVELVMPRSDSEG
jgi:signal transduction histidine kinase